MTYASSSSTVGHYVTSQRDRQRSVLIGPYPSARIARQHIPRAQELAQAVDSFAGFDSYGTARVTAPAGAYNGPGLLNHRLGQDEAAARTLEPGMIGRGMEGPDESGFYGAVDDDLIEVLRRFDVPNERYVVVSRPSPDEVYQALTAHAESRQGAFRRFALMKSKSPDADHVVLSRSGARRLIWTQPPLSVRAIVSDRLIAPQALGPVDRRLAKERRLPPPGPPYVEGDLLVHWTLNINGPPRGLLRVIKVNSHRSEPGFHVVAQDTGGQRTTFAVGPGGQNETIDKWSAVRHIVRHRIGREQLAALDAQAETFIAMRPPEVEGQLDVHHAAAAESAVMKPVGKGHQTELFGPSL